MKKVVDMITLILISIFLNHLLQNLLNVMIILEIMSANLATRTMNAHFLLYFKIFLNKYFRVILKVHLWLGFIIKIISYQVMIFNLSLMTNNSFKNITHFHHLDALNMKLIFFSHKKQMGFWDWALLQTLLPISQT